MSISFSLPDELESQLRAEFTDLDQVAKEAALVELFRQAKLTHYELSQALGLERFETDAVLKRHRVEDDSLTSEDIQEQVAYLLSRSGNK